MVRISPSLEQLRIHSCAHVNHLAHGLRPGDGVRRARVQIVEVRVPRHLLHERVRCLREFRGCISNGIRVRVTCSTQKRCRAQAAVDTGATCGVLATGGGTKTVPRGTAAAAKPQTKRVRLDCAGAIATFDATLQLQRCLQDLNSRNGCDDLILYCPCQQEARYVVETRCVNRIELYGPLSDRKRGTQQQQRVYYTRTYATALPLDDKITSQPSAGKRGSTSCTSWRA